MNRFKSILVLIGLFFSMNSFAENYEAILPNPDKTLKYLFPTLTRYEVKDLLPEQVFSQPEKIKNIEKEFKVNLKSFQLNLDSPHRFYTVYTGAGLLGVVYGGVYKISEGMLQLFVGYKPNGQIQSIYIQKMDSPAVSHFRSRFFLNQFKSYGTEKIIDIAYINPPLRLPSQTSIKDHHIFVTAVNINAKFTKYFHFMSQ